MKAILSRFFNRRIFVFQAGKSVEPVIIRIPLHSEASLDKENGIYPEPEEILEVGEIAADMISSPQQYQEDTEVDDEDERIEFQEEQRFSIHCIKSRNHNNGINSFGISHVKKVVSNSKFFFKWDCNKSCQCLFFQNIQNTIEYKFNQLEHLLFS